MGFDSKGQIYWRHTQGGMLDIDNNITKRMVKLPFIRRNNRTFPSITDGGRPAAILLSLIATAQYFEVDS